jgi:hypothetical protein
MELFAPSVRDAMTIAGVVLSTSSSAKASAMVNGSIVGIGPKI